MRRGALSQAPNVTWSRNTVTASEQLSLLQIISLGIWNIQGKQFSLVDFVNVLSIKSITTKG